MRTAPPTAARWLVLADTVGAALLLVAGWVHLELYFDGYRSAGSAWLGRSFLADVVVSTAIAALLVLRPPRLLPLLRVAGLVVALGAIGAFVKSRSGSGIFDFREHGLDPSPEALIAVLAEVGAALAMAAALLLGARSGVEASAPAARARGQRALVAAGVVVAATIGLGVLWSASADDTPVAGAGGAGGAGADAVTIADFAFGPEQLAVKAGSEVTWTNHDGFAHSVVAGDGSFRSDDLDQGASFTHRFDAPGTFAYICGIHPSMTGTITVT